MKTVKLSKVNKEILEVSHYTLEAQYVKRDFPAVSTWDIIIFDTDNEIYVGELCVFEYVGNADFVNEFVEYLGIRFEIEEELKC